MRSDGKSTLGDSLSPEMRERMGRLREDLLRRAQETIKTQLNQPIPPWQRRTALSPDVRARSAKSAPGKSSSAVATTRAVSRVAGAVTAKPKTTKLPPGSAPQSAPPEPAPFEYWELPLEASVRELPPTTISVERLSSLQTLLDAGASGSSAGEELFATIGLDFGTSTTKLVVRFPYEPGAPAIAIPAPDHCQSMGQPYLWQTVLWFDDTGTFTAWPQEQSHLLHALKQGVMKHPAVDAIASGGKSVGLTTTEAATAFLATAVRYARGWLHVHRPQLFRNRRPVWFLNVGMPVARIDDTALVSTYRRAAAAASLLGNLAGPLTLDQTRAFLLDPHVLSAAQSTAQAEKLGVAVLPETAAEAAGFAKSTNRAPGVYVMVDVGAMTFDVCTFRLSEESGTDLYALSAAEVRPLGVEAYYWFIAQGKAEPDFVEQCERCARGVIWETKQFKDPLADCWERGNVLPVFIAGGGANNALHRQIVEALGPWLQYHSQNGGIRLLDLPMPTNIDTPAPLSDFGRLAVAWGLSYPPTEIGDVFPPSAIRDKVPAAPADFTNRLVTKEMV